MTGSVAVVNIPQARISTPMPKGDRYRPPPEVGEVMLSAALCGTGRFPEHEQFSLFGGATAVNERPDLKLYFAGDLSLLKRPCVAIVGTRRVSDAGASRTWRLARELVEAGVVVVSGLAVGVDTAAHMSAIDAGGKTVAVIGTPLNKAYPAENKRLQEMIYQDHLLISQFAIGKGTFRTSFPQRNKLMAALTDATVVMEASDTSGTLHQAVECIRLNRWLFIAKSVVDDRSLTWPQKFLDYERCLALEAVADITKRVLRRSG